MWQMCHRVGSDELLSYKYHFLWLFIMATYIILNKKVRRSQQLENMERTKKVKQVIKLYILIGHRKNKYEFRRDIVNHILWVTADELLISLLFPRYTNKIIINKSELRVSHNHLIGVKNNSSIGHQEPGISMI